MLRPRSARLRYVLRIACVLAMSALGAGAGGWLITTAARGVSIASGYASPSP